MEPSGTGPAQAVISAWVHVVRGHVGLGCGNGGDIDVSTISTTLGRWERLSTPNGRSPANEVILYATDPEGAEFLVDEVTVSPVGQVRDYPVPEDYDGNGRGDAAIWRPAEGTWYVQPASGGPTRRYYTRQVPQAPDPAERRVLRRSRGASNLALEPVAQSRLAKPSPRCGSGSPSSTGSRSSTRPSSDRTGLALVDACGFGSRRDRPAGAFLEGRRAVQIFESLAGIPTTTTWRRTTPTSPGTSSPGRLNSSRGPSGSQPAAATWTTMRHRVALYERRAVVDPVRYQPRLAQALVDLSGFRARTRPVPSSRHPGRADPQTLTGITDYTALAGLTPDANWGTLSGALYFLAFAQRKTGDWVGALTSIHHRVALHEQLAATGAPTDRTALAGAHGPVSGVRRGRPTTLQRAVELHEQVLGVDANYDNLDTLTPDTRWEDLAGALGVLARAQWAATPPTPWRPTPPHRALERLAETNPTAYRARLATCCSSWGTSRTRIRPAHWPRREAA